MNFVDIIGQYRLDVKATKEYHFEVEKKRHGGSIPDELAQGLNDLWDENAAELEKITLEITESELVLDNAVEVDRSPLRHEIKDGKIILYAERIYGDAPILYQEVKPGYVRFVSTTIDLSDAVFAKIR